MREAGARPVAEPDAVEATEDDLRAALLAEAPLLHAQVAEVAVPGGPPEVAGMALWFVSYSTWRGRHGIWLEDLFVRPAARRLGLGRALLADLAATCVARGYTRLEWAVLDWNEPARRFYGTVGARELDEWIINPGDGDALPLLAVEGELRNA